MPRTLPPIPDPTDNTDGAMFVITKVPGTGTQAQRTHVQVNFPADPDGAFNTTLAAVTAAERTALANALQPFITLYKAARGYV